MRRCCSIVLLLAACGSDQVLEHDLEPIPLRRAPVEPGGAAVGGLLAAVSTEAGIAPLLVDTAFPMNSLSRPRPCAPRSARWGSSTSVRGRSATARSSRPA